ncbi:ATP-binding protein [Sorangium sp. So ce1036]|uniref:sensor histidine kinase n=1 Tax=Sorangium sp. So ce1036 TaxID=3133328 RepID=UPI003F005FB2
MDTPARPRPSSGPSASADPADLEALKREIERLRVAASRNRGWLHAVLEHSPHGVILCDAAGRLVLHNRAAERIWGGSASTESMSDWTRYRAFHADGRPYEASDWAMARAMASGQTIENEETRIVRFDGTEGVLLGSAAPIVGPLGELEGGISVFVDISRLKQVEAERVELAEQLRRQVEELDRGARVMQALLAVSTALSGAVTVDQVAHAALRDIHRVLGASTTMMYTADEAAGVATLTGHLGLEAQRTSAYLTVRLDARLPLSEALRERRAIWVSDKRGLHAAYPELAALRPPRDDIQALAVLPIIAHAQLLGGLAISFAGERAWGAEDRELLLSVAAQCASALDRARLLDREREARARAETLAAELERQHAELDKFAYVASHDLKAPLRGIANLAQWIEDDLSDRLTEGTRHQMELLRGRVRRMEALIEGILAYSRATRHREEPESVSLERLAREVVELIAPRPPATVAIDVPPAVLWTHRVPLQQVVMNLVTNALKHAGRDDAAVILSAREQGDWYEVSVADNGPGIAPAFQEKVWGMFQTLQARDKVENTGIGLAIVRKIVESRGGRAWVESDGKSGATFRFTWPRREAQAAG